MHFTIFHFECALLLCILLCFWFIHSLFWYLEECNRDVDVLWDRPHHHPPVGILDSGLPTVELHTKQFSDTVCVCVCASVSVYVDSVSVFSPWSTCVCSSWSTPPSACLVAYRKTQTQNKTQIKAQK